MRNIEHIKKIAEELALKPYQVEAAVKLLDAENTIAFIARYRKEATGSLDEVQLRQIEKKITYLRNLDQRKDEVLTSIDKQGKLTDELKEKILNATTLVEVEDLYLPYKPKKRTKGQKAKEMGLEPLAELILKQDKTDGNPEKFYKEYLNPEKKLNTIEDVKTWVSYLIAEIIAETAEIREKIRTFMFQTGEIHSDKIKEEFKNTEFDMYFDYKESVSAIPPHRILAINRGENKGVLKVKIKIEKQQALEIIEDFIIKNKKCIFIDLIKSSIEDGFKRLIFPSIEREIRNALTEKAELHAIKIFGTNLKNLLISPPVRDKTIMGIDPGYRTGCKVAVIDKYGNYLEGATIYPTPPHNKIEESEAIVKDLILKHSVDIIAIGNGTASRETETFIANLIKKIDRNVVYIIVSEAGASVYSASKVALEEFPELEASMRGNISIARRVLDPLSELVKIDPKSIGVGLYQHDVNQKELSEELAEVVKSVVNYVGVDLNNASVSLLQYVSGINKNIAKKIVEYRKKHGPFKSRYDLLKVPGIGEHTFQQCAGFLRIPESDNILDNTNIHPESYHVCEELFKKFNLDINDLSKSFALLKFKMKSQNISIEKLAEELEVGIPTLEDIFENLEKPGRDPRDVLPKPLFKEDVLKLEDLKVGMVVQGTVRNVVDFGAFVDIGIKRDALLHKSEIDNKFIKHPIEVLSVGDIINVKVIDIDMDRQRVSLSMKGVTS